MSPIVRTIASCRSTMMPVESGRVYLFETSNSVSSICKRTLTMCTSDLNSGI